MHEKIFLFPFFLVYRMYNFATTNIWLTDVPVWCHSLHLCENWYDLLVSSRENYLVLWILLESEKCYKNCNKILKFGKSSALYKGDRWDDFFLGSLSCEFTDLLASLFSYCEKKDQNAWQKLLAWDENIIKNIFWVGVIFGGILGANKHKQFMFRPYLILTSEVSWHHETHV